LARADWQIAAELASEVGIELGFDTLDEIHGEIINAAGSVATIDWNEVANGADGPLLNVERNWDLEFGEAASSPPSASYGLRLVVDRKLWDLGTMVQNSSSLAKLPTAAALHIAPTDAQMMDLANRDFVTIDQGDVSFDLPFVIDSRVAPKTAWLPARLPGFDVRELLSAGRSITNSGFGFRCSLGRSHAHGLV